MMSIINCFFFKNRDTVVKNLIFLFASVGPGRIFKEDIKVSKIYIRKVFYPNETKKNFMICERTILIFPTFKMIETESYRRKGL